MPAKQERDNLINKTIVEALNQKLSEYKIPIGLLVLGGVLLIGGLFSSNLIKKDSSTQGNFPKESIVSQSSLSEVKVDIAGAVNNPGVFSLNKEARIEDAIKLAGGFNPNVNEEYVSKHLNLSQRITDGLKIYIPFEGEGLGGGTGVGVIAGAATSVSATPKIGINSAQQGSLESLPGIGPVTAKKIIDNRPYGSLEELLSKKSVSKSVYTKILELVDLN